MALSASISWAWSTFAIPGMRRSTAATTACSSVGRFFGMSMTSTTGFESSRVRLNTIRPLSRLPLARVS